MSLLRRQGASPALLIADRSFLDHTCQVYLQVRAAGSRLNPVLTLSVHSGDNLMLLEQITAPALLTAYDFDDLDQLLSTTTFPCGLDATANRYTALLPYAESLDLDD
jgi:hypothetical protein